jgi:hypothetical protein
VITRVNDVSKLPTRAFFATNTSNIGFLRDLWLSSGLHTTPAVGPLERIGRLRRRILTWDREADGGPPFTGIGIASFLARRRWQLGRAAGRIYTSDRNCKANEVAWRHCDRALLASATRLG